MTTAEQFLVMSLITAAITLGVALVLSATAIWLVEFLPVHMRLLRMRTRHWRRAMLIWWMRLRAWFKRDDDLDPFWDIEDWHWGKKEPPCSKP